MWACGHVMKKGSLFIYCNILLKAYTVSDPVYVTLVFSSLGYDAQEITVNSTASSIDVALVGGVALDEVVITGLGTSIKRSNLANAVSTVSAEELVGNTAQPTVDGALYGKLTGVNIVSSSGAPGGGFALRLRGISSINGNNQPLFIIDGTPVGHDFLSAKNAVKPQEIESVEVRTGPDSAIYGMQGANGVIVIRTHSF